MPKRSLVQAVVVVVALCIIVWAGVFFWQGRALVAKSNEVSSGGKLINTEDSSGPEIIIDKDQLENLPQPETDGKTMEEIEEEQEDNPNMVVPATFNLDIPFYAQAPDGNWELPWKEACEESSIILAHYFLADRSLSLSKFKEEVLSMTKLQEEIFGSAIDTTVAQTAQLYTKYYGTDYKTKIINNPTIKQIKYELSQGHPVVAPFAGKKLWNSNFTNGGPRYHMLVIRGYDEKYFYTNDVGTRLGENFPYTYAVIIDALHDLVPEGKGDIATWKKKILVLMKE